MISMMKFYANKSFKSYTTNQQTEFQKHNAQSCTVNSSQSISFNISHQQEQEDYTSLTKYEKEDQRWSRKLHKTGELQTLPASSVDHEICYNSRLTCSTTVCSLQSSRSFEANNKVLNNYENEKAQSSIITLDISGNSSNSLKAQQLNGGEESWCLNECSSKASLKSCRSCRYVQTATICCSTSSRLTTTSNANCSISENSLNCNCSRSSNFSNWNPSNSSIISHNVGDDKPNSKSTSTTRLPARTTTIESKQNCSFISESKSRSRTLSQTPAMSSSSSSSPLSTTSKLYPKFLEPQEKDQQPQSSAQCPQERCNIPKSLKRSRTTLASGLDSSSSSSSSSSPASTLFAVASVPATVFISSIYNNIIRYFSLQLCCLLLLRLCLVTTSLAVGMDTANANLTDLGSPGMYHKHTEKKNI